MPAEGHHRHKKQTRRRGTVRRGVSARRAAAARRGFEFVDDVVGGTIPGQFIPAVEKGVRQVLEQARSRAIRCRTSASSVYDGKHHPVDSKEVAFVTAGQEGVHRRDPEGAPDRARADRQAAGDGAEQHDGRHHGRPLVAARPHPRQHDPARQPRAPSTARCRSPRSRTTSRA